MSDFLAEYGGLVGWLFVVSMVMFVVGLIVVPWIVVKLPADYFVPGKRRPLINHSQHPVLRLMILVAKNVLGGVLLVAGVAMLVLPGQGLLTILMGLMLLNFPGKWRLERYIVSRPAILGSMNWLRARQGREPLKMKG
jgi:hypothetical protein